MGCRTEDEGHWIAEGAVHLINAKNLLLPSLTAFCSGRSSRTPFVPGNCLRNFRVESSGAESLCLWLSERKNFCSIVNNSQYTIQCASTRSNVCYKARQSSTRQEQIERIALAKYGKVLLMLLMIVLLSPCFYFFSHIFGQPWELVVELMLWAIPLAFHMIRIPRCGVSISISFSFAVCTSFVLCRIPICLRHYCLRNISESFSIHSSPRLSQHLLCAFGIGHHHCGLIIIICLLNWPEFADPWMRACKSRMLPKQSWFSITTNI